MTNLIMMYGISFLSIMLIMFFLWGIYLFKKNVAIVDLGWCISFMITGITFFSLGGGWLPKRLVLLGMILIWSILLLAYIYKKYRTLPPDPRYARMVNKWDQEGIIVKVLILFLFQGFLALVISNVFLFPFKNGTAGWHYFEIIGLILWAIGVIGEYQSNDQLLKFKLNPENKGKVYCEGWWKYSRHPNYFFEFVVWLGFSFFALGSNFGFTGVISPMIILYLLRNLSGIPLAEEQSMKSSSEEYRVYQKKTNAFFPWFPKS